MSMKGCEVALATLMREQVDEPCINYGWMTSSSYISKVAGRDYWSDREGVFFDYLRACKINLVPQYYFPSEKHRNLEEGRRVELGRVVDPVVLRDVLRELRLQAVD